MTTVTRDQKAAAIKAYLEVCAAVLETVKECGAEGAPGGVLYAALMETGITLERFEQLMGILVDSGRVVKRGHVYHARYASGEAPGPSNRRGSVRSRHARPIYPARWIPGAGLRIRRYEVRFLGGVPFTPRAESRAGLLNQLRPV